MRNTLLACLALLAIPVMAVAATGTGGPDKMRVVNHVRSQEKENAFHLRERIGGAFYLGGAYCEEPKVGVRGLMCRYNATQIGIDAQGKRTYCTIDVKVTRRNARHTRWHRWIEACATSFRPAPPGP